MKFFCFRYLKHERNLSGSHLVIVPKDEQQFWHHEMDQWIPRVFSRATVQGNAIERGSTLSQPTMIYGRIDVVFATFEAFVEEVLFLDLCALSHIHFECLRLNILRVSVG